MHFIIYVFMYYLFIGMTLIHKTIQVSSVQVNKTLSLHCIMHPSPRAKSLSIRIPLLCPPPPRPDPPFPRVITTLLSCLCVCVYVCIHMYIHTHTYIYTQKHICKYIWGFFCLIPSASFILPPTSLPSDSCQSVPYVYASVSILLISLFCSLESTYKWDRMVFVFLWLAYFS